MEGVSERDAVTKVWRDEDVADGEILEEDGPVDVPGDELGGLEVDGASSVVDGTVSVGVGLCDSEPPVVVEGGLSDVVSSPGVELGPDVGSLLGSPVDDGGAVVLLARFASSGTASAASSSDAQTPCLKRSGKYLWRRAWSESGAASSTAWATESTADSASRLAISSLRRGRSTVDMADATPKAAISDTIRTNSKRRAEGMFSFGAWYSREVTGGLPAARMSSFSDRGLKWPASSSGPSRWGGDAMTF